MKITKKSLIETLESLIEINKETMEKRDLPEFIDCGARFLMQQNNDFNTVINIINTYEETDCNDEYIENLENERDSFMEKVEELKYPPDYY